MPRDSASLAEPVLWQCAACGFPGRPIPVRRNRFPVHHNCSAAGGGILANVWSYGKAVARWVAAGRPKRGKPETERILAICRSCEHYNGVSCSKCGCKIARTQSALRNKIRMATEHCPEEQW